MECFRCGPLRYKACSLASSAGHQRMRNAAQRIFRRAGRVSGRVRLPRPQSNALCPPNCVLSLLPLPGPAARPRVTLAEDGAVCWFQDPRALTAGGKTFAGWVSSRGNVGVSSLHHTTRETTSAVVDPRLQVRRGEAAMQRLHAGVQGTGQAGSRHWTRMSRPDGGAAESAST